MLRLELGGRLGNQMYQYAAVRALAEEKGLDFACAYNGRFQPPESRLETCFRLEGDRELCGPEVQQAWDEASQRSRRRFSPYRERRPEGILREMFDPSFWDVQDGTYIRGGFQCPRYFAGRRASVLSWYTPHEQFLAELREVEARWPSSPDRRCCVAIRRSDYATLDKGLAYGSQGWMLPASYYREALGQLPEDLFYVFVSDDPGFVRETFADIEPKYVSENQPPAVQMFLLTLCRYNVIANSSFSWWGAWCNQTPSKEVIAPLYHLGWAKRIWHPGGMVDMPPEWRSIDVLETIEL